MFVPKCSPRRSEHSKNSFPVEKDKTHGVMTVLFPVNQSINQSIDTRHLHDLYGNGKCQAWERSIDWLIEDYFIFVFDENFFYLFVLS